MRFGPGMTLGLLTLWLCGCRRDPARTAEPPARHPTVASLVPAATDLIIAMGARNHLVAVSNYDSAAEAGDLPRVGDYQAIDWEKLAQLRPNVIISFYGPGHTPAGFIERTDRLGIERINVHMDRLDEIDRTLTTLGDALRESEAAAAESKRIRRRIKAVRERARNLPVVPALIAIDPSGTDLVGPGTFLDDLLQAAGGKNVLKADHYVTLDREAVSALRPKVILQLLPDRDAKAAGEAAARWNSLTEIPAVRDHRVCVFTESFIEQPGPRVADTAELFLRALHPAPDSRPSAGTGS